MFKKKEKTNQPTDTEILNDLWKSRIKDAEESNERMRVEYLKAKELNDSTIRFAQQRINELNE